MGLIVCNGFPYLRTVLQFSTDAKYGRWHLVTLPGVNVHPGCVSLGGSNTKASELIVGKKHPLLWVTSFTVP